MSAEDTRDLAPRAGGDIQPDEILAILNSPRHSANDDTRKDVNPSNPKDAAARGRVPLWMVPSSFLIYAAMGFAEGDSKYIAYNWRAAPVRLSVYLSAWERHLARFKNGEWADKKTRIPHLASTAACNAIIIDAHEHGTLVDDRPPAQDLDRLMAEAEACIAHVYQINEAIRPKNLAYTLANTPAALRELIVAE